MQIRPMVPGEEQQWVSLGCSDPEQSKSRLQDLIEYRADNPQLDPRSYLVMAEGDRLIAKFRVMADEPTMFICNQVVVGAGHDYAMAVRSFLEFAKGNLRERELVAASWERSEDEAWHQGLLAAGFQMYIEKVYFRRKLERYRAEADAGLNYRTLASMGQDEFFEHFATLYKGPLDRSFQRDKPDVDFQDFVETAGEVLGTSRWLVAFDGEEPVGVVMPKIFDDIRDEGTIHCFGVFPEFRGKGLGRVLHARGLEELATAGAVTYVGSTDRNNLAMQSVFVANGCERRGVRRQYRLKR